MNEVDLGHHLRMGDWLLGTNCGLGLSIAQPSPPARGEAED